MVPTSSPKLEDFLGASMGCHEYGGQESELAMSLSLDSIYYSTQNAGDPHQANRDHSLELLSHPYYSGLDCHGMYQSSPLEEENKETGNVTACSSQIVEYSAQHAVEQKMNCNIVNDRGNAASGGGSVGCGGELQSLSLSMSPGTQSSCVTVPSQISPSGSDSVAGNGKKRGAAKMGQKQPVHRKSIDTFGQRTSQYRGVTRLVQS